MECSLLSVLLFVLGVVVAFLAWYLLINQKIFAKFQTRLLPLEPATLIYTKYQGNYHHMMSFVEMMKSDFRSFCTAHNMDFDKFALFGVYYDPPAKLLDITKGRAIVGILVRKGDDSKFIDSFLQYPTQLEYVTCSHKSLSAFGAKFPLTGKFSMLSAIIRGYPAIKKFGEERGLLEKTVCSYEVYEHGKDRLTISFPYNDEAKKLSGLSGFPLPPYKPSLSG